MKEDSRNRIMDTINDKGENEFVTFILSMISSTLVQLGDLPNPTTQQLDMLDLPSAKVSIDTLDLLHRKTQGNLTQEEEQTFTNLLAQVKLRYIAKLQQVSK